MRLNPDVVRDVLLYLEQNLKMKVEDGKIVTNEFTMETLADKLTPSERYTKEEAIYAIEQLYYADLIDATVQTGKGGQIIYCEVKDIKWAGHEFLNNVRSDTVWNATKEKATKLGGMSIRALASLSSMVIQAIISNPQLINNILESIK